MEYLKESSIKQNREKSVMRDDGIHYKSNIDYSESHSMVAGDTFYEVYHNPDAGSGDQFVELTIPLDYAIELYDECDRNFSEFYDMISSEGKVYLADINDGTGEYTAFKEDWKDGIEFTQKNLEKLLFGKSVKESKVITVYKVTIGFSEYSGATMDYEVVAEDEDEAIYMALEQAADDLEIENVDDLGDGTYDVYVRFSEYYGSMVHNVTADDEGEAEELALIEATNDDLEVVDVKLVSTPVTESRLVVQYFDNKGDSQSKEIIGKSARDVKTKLKRVADRFEIYKLYEVSRDLKDDEYINQFDVYSINYNESKQVKEARINKITDFTEHSSGNMFIFRCEREDGLHEYFVGIDKRWSDGTRFKNGDTIAYINVADTLIVDGEKADTERGTLPIKYTKQDVAWQLKPGCIYTHKDIEQFYEDLKYLAAEDFAVDAWLFKILDHVTILDHIAKSGSPEYRTENKRRIKESRKSIADETNDYFYVFGNKISWVHFGADDKGEYVKDYKIPLQTWEQAVKNTNNNVDKLFDYLAQNCHCWTTYKNEFRKLYDSYNPTTDDSIFATGISSNTVNAIQKQFDHIAHLNRPMPNKYYSVDDYRDNIIENFETEEEAIEYAIHNEDAEKVCEVENGLGRVIWNKADYEDEIECDECGERWPSSDIKRTSMGNLCPRCLDYLTTQGYDVDVHYGESMRSRRAVKESVYDMNYSYDEFLENGYKYITWYAENPLCMCLIMRLRNEDDSYDGVQLIPTVNFGHDIGNSTLMPKYCAFIDIYNNPEIDTWLEEKGLAEPYRRFGSDVEMQGNFGTYPLYQFSKEALKKYGFDGLDEYEENWQKEFEEEQAQMNKDFYSQYVQESNNKNWYESEFTQDERSAKDKLLKYLKTKSIPFEVSGIDAEIDGKMGSLGWNVRISASPEQAEEINTMIDNNEFE